MPPTTPSGETRSGTVGSNLAADGDGNGSIDADDYTVWKNHFGQSLGPGSGCVISRSRTGRIVLLSIAACFALTYARVDGEKCSYFARSVRIVASLCSVFLPVNLGTTSALLASGMSIETVTLSVVEVSVAGRDGHDGIAGPDDVQDRVGLGLRFGRRRARHHRVPRRFVSRVVGRVPQHVQPAKLERRHQKQDEQRQRERKLDHRRPATRSAMPMSAIVLAHVYFIRTCRC